MASTKDAIRKDALARRAAVDAAQRAALSLRLAEAGTALAAAFARGHRITVSLFSPMRGEPDPWPFVSAFDDVGHVTALPVTPPRGEPLRFRLWQPGDALVQGRFGTVEPAAIAAEAEPDILVVPLAAYDRRGFRLGYGAGYYDGALRRLRRLKPILAVGVAFGVQEVSAVPTEPHDERLDALVSDHGLLTFGSP